MSQAVVVQAVKKIKLKLKPHQLALVKQVPAVVLPAVVLPAVVLPAVVVPAVVVPAVDAPADIKKIKVKSNKLAHVKKPVVEAPIQTSIWMSVARLPKEKPLAIVWEGVEDISDDEDDTPQAAGKRLSTLKATRDQIQRRAYKAKVAELQNAGLFLNWEKKVHKTHSNYSYDVQSTAIHPINKY